MLEGRLEDEAALAGVLNTLFELMVPVLLAQRLDAPDDDRSVQNETGDLP